MTNLLNIINDKGRAFNVVVLNKGDKYGRDNCLTHDEEKPLVEFYDATHDFAEHGQFVSRYYLETILAATTGIDLMGYAPEWKIDNGAMTIVRAWLANQINR